LTGQLSGHQKFVKRSRVLPITVEGDEDCRRIRLHGDFSVTSAAELKEALLQGIASGKAVKVDLEHVGQIDLTVLQLLWAARREGAFVGAGCVSGVSEAVAGVARDAGFEQFPGISVAD
jgi:anti-anti-sigma regulatory factor